MNAHSLRTRPRRQAKIGLTALIDVVFILLLFFMLSTSFSQWHKLPIKLNSGQSQRVSLKESMTVYLLEEHIEIAAERFELTELGVLDLKAQSWFDPQKRYFLKPLKTSSVQQIVDVMTGLSAAGLPQVQLAKVPDD